MQAELHWKCTGHPHIVSCVDVFQNELVLPGETQPKYNIITKHNLFTGGARGLINVYQAAEIRLFGWETHFYHFFYKFQKSFFHLFKKIDACDHFEFLIFLT